MTLLNKLLNNERMKINFEALRNKNAIKLALIYQQKTMIWLSNQLGYSPQYMYQCINNRNEDELLRIKNIIKILYVEE